MTPPVKPSTELPASLVVRLGAFTYDLFLLFAVGFAYSALAYAIAIALGLEMDQEHVSITSEGDLFTMQADEEFRPALGGPLFQLGLVVSYLIFYLGFWHFKGATLGMQTWRLKLVSETGHKASWSQLLLRSLLGFLALAAFGLGYFWMLLDPKKLAFHDRFSKTRVIRLSKISKKK